MPYIKKIELKGFKSFGPQTVKVVLDKGFTAIIGPNGSGKTNIVDATLFALGELSTRRLRAENAAKLIFHGSEKAGLERAKMAKVIIQFDNSDGRMPVDTATLQFRGRFIETVKACIDLTAEESQGRTS
jgi:chromosome segregation protein